MSTGSSNEQQQQLPGSRVPSFASLGQNMPIAGNPGSAGGSSVGGSCSVNSASTSGGQVVNMPGNVGPVQMPGILSPASALEHYRLTQLYQYAMAAERLRCPPGSFMPPMPPGIRPELAPLFYGPYCRIDPRLAGLCRPPEEPKPQHSYIGLIAMAILSSPEKKLVLSDIYQYILDNFPYFRARGPGWRNSIRHNLSLNDCFVKAGRSANGKGHFWSIHCANLDDFSKGDFRRRRAQRKVRKHMGLAVDDDDSPSPPPVSPPPAWHNPHHPMSHPHLGNPMNLSGSSQNPGLDIPATLFGLTAAAAAANLGQKTPPGHPDSLHSHLHSVNQSLILNRKRQFDVASLLAPEKDPSGRGALSPSSCKSDEHDRDQSLSSPSPPPTGLFKRAKSSSSNKKSEQSTDSEQSDNEDIEVLAEDEENPKNQSPSERKVRHKSGKSEEEPNNGSSSPHKNSRSFSSESNKPVGQDANSSNDEDDGYCRHSSRMPNYNGQQSRFHPLQQGLSVNDAFSNQNQLNHHGQFPQSNLPHGVMSPLDFIQAQHFIQQHQQQQQQHQNNMPNHPQNAQGFPFGPGGPNLLQQCQQNPSLASLMILSSRYREMTSNMINASRRSPQ